MTYIRKSFEIKSNNYVLQEDQSHGYSYTSYAHPPRPQYARGRCASNQKKYDYQSQINESKQIRPRTPSAGEFNKYSIALTGSEAEFSNTVSHGKLKKIAKNYASGLGNTNFSDLNINQKPNHRGKYTSFKQDPIVQVQRKQNINSRNLQYKGRRQEYQPKDRSYSKKYNEQDTVKDSFQRVNEQKILQKISRINKLNSEINGRLQKILAKVSSQQ